MSKELEKEINRLFPADRRIFNIGGRKGRSIIMTERVQVMVTDKMLEAIDFLVEIEKFPNRSEFIRHLIVKYFDNIKSDYRYDKRDLDAAYKRGYNNGK